MLIINTITIYHTIYIYVNLRFTLFQSFDDFQEILTTTFPMLACVLRNLCMCIA